VNSREAARIGLGLTGVWALLYAITGFMGIVATFTIFPGAVSPRTLLLAEAVPVALLLAVGYILVFHNAQVATAIFPEFGAASEHGSADLARILVCLAGVVLLGQVIPGVIGGVFSYFAARDFQDASTRALEVRASIGYVAQLAFALYLITRPGRILAYVRRPEPEPVG
jgi:hypothetical protein